MRNKFYVLVVACVGALFFVVFFKLSLHRRCAGRIATPFEPILAPIIFVGGMPKSGTTLMRFMLESHPDIRCGPETGIIPSTLGWLNVTFAPSFLLPESDITDDLVDSALAAFIYEIIARHGRGAKRLCNKDPLAHRHLAYLSRLFPNAKFLLMIRDGRAEAYSMSHGKTHEDRPTAMRYWSALSAWNEGVSTMYEQCERVGLKRCLSVFYENVVLNTEKQMQEIIRFLDLRWDDSVLHHEQYVGDRIALAKYEKDGKYTVGVNRNELRSWVGLAPDEVIRNASIIAPMLAKFGYDLSIPNARNETLEDGEEDGYENNTTTADYYSLEKADKWNANTTTADDSLEKTDNETTFNLAK